MHILFLVSFANVSQGFDRAVSQSLDSIQSKSNWVQRDHADVEQWLKTNGFLLEQKL
jgi:hypothetical protein